MLLSFRFLTDDQFWFTFFHEAGHLLLHGNRRLFLEGVGANKEAEEAEANKFAEDILIPPQFARELAELRLETRNILSFAKRLGVSPGIIIGQLQHNGRVDPSKLNSFKRRYQWGSSTI